MNLLVAIDDYLLARAQSCTDWFQIKTGKNCYWVTSVLLGFDALYLLVVEIPSALQRHFNDSALYNLTDGIMFVLVSANIFLAFILLSRAFVFAKRARHDTPKPPLWGIGVRLGALFLIALLMLPFLYIMLHIIPLLPRMGLGDLLFVAGAVCFLVFLASFVVIVYVGCCSPLPPQRAPRGEKRSTRLDWVRPPQPV